MKKAFIFVLIGLILCTSAFAQGSGEQDKIVIRWGSVHTKKDSCRIYSEARRLDFGCEGIF